MKKLAAFFNFKVMIRRIDATEKAVELIKILKEKHGDLMFYQAGGCCEGTQPHESVGIMPQGVTACAVPGVANQ